MHVHARVCAGQGIVQMARHCRTRKEYAIKFYVSGKAFEEERGMYSPDSGSQGADLCQFLPQVRLSPSLQRFYCISYIHVLSFIVC